MQAVKALTFSSSATHRQWLSVAVPALLFVLSILLTRPAFLGDSFNYVNEILRAMLGTAPASTLWEAGHILWRPVGYILSPLFLRLIPNQIAWTPALQIGAGLIAVNICCAVVCAVLIYDLSRHLMGSHAWAVLPTLLFVWSDAILSYSRSATAYIPALALLIIGLWWQLTADTIRGSSLVGPACLFALAALFWLPFAVVIPAACCARRFIELPNIPKRCLSWNQVLLSLVIAGTLLASGIALAALLGGVRSTPHFAAWMVASGHDLRQDRQLVRAISGCTRLFLELGTDGVYMKRFVFHDPYFPVSTLSLIRHSLLKLGLFYLFIGSVVVMAWRSPGPRNTLAPFALAVAPSLLFAIVVFEPSSPERFLPVLPFLLITLAAALGPSSQPILLRALVCFFPLLLPVMNFLALEPRLSMNYHQALAQLNTLRQMADPDDVILALTISEPIVQFDNLHPFDEFNRAPRVRILWAIDPRAADPSRWPIRFAQSVQQYWREGHNVWVDKAALADRPADYLLWTEGDAENLHWRDIPNFFHSLTYDADTGNTDGFLRISHSVGNQERLLQLSP